jgi:allantoinase
MPAAPAWILRSRRVLIDGAECPAAIQIRDGQIEELLAFDQQVPGVSEILDVGDTPVLPGFVDTHVHVNEPGRTEWEGFATATRAAAAGGITAVVDMPLNSLPVTTTPEALAAKVASARGQTHVDVAFWGGLIPANAANLAPLLDAGVLGVKAFMIDSGIPEFPEARVEDLRAAMPTLARHGVPLLLHAEVALPHVSPPAGDPRLYGTYLASRPPAMEVEAIRLAIALCREYRCPTHIVHLSAADALPDLAAARAEGVPITVETCPHYLALAAEEVPDGATAFKCAPPIRDRANQERLWQGLRDGVIDFVACDHSPCTPDLKKSEAGDFMAAWGGIASVQFAPAIVWTHARARGFGLGQVAEWLSGRPARFCGLGLRKGRIAPGFDADLTVWDPDARFTVEPAIIRHKHPVTPYAGKTLQGVALRTFVRGQEAGSSQDPVAGDLLLRPAAGGVSPRRPEVPESAERPVADEPGAPRRPMIGN